MTPRRSILIFVIAAGLFSAAALLPWHADANVRRATGVVLATLVLWITEVAPLGVTAMAIPIVATFTRLLPWNQAVAAWGSDVVFLFLGAFLLARALDKHGVFDWIVTSRWAVVRAGDSGMFVALLILIMAGVLSLAQNNTAVTAIMLPVVLAISRKVKAPAAALLALAWGATFGGMALPVGTAPNFIGYSAMKKLDETVNFITWMRVGIPVWLGTTVIGWGVLAIGTRWLIRSAAGAPAPTHAHPLFEGLDDVGPVPASRPAASAEAAPAPRGNDKPATSPEARRFVVVAFAAAVLLWLVPGLVRSTLPHDHAASQWIATYLPESLVPVLVSWILFMAPFGPGRRTILDRHDFQALDWDTLFLIAGGLSLGQMLDSSGFAQALAQGLAGARLPPLLLMLGLVGTTVLLSELTSNTATAALMVPVAGSLAAALGLSPVQAIWLVALAASLGFALPVSTPPNAIVYGTRLIPLRFMVVTGIAVDVLSTIWLVCCVSVFK